MCRDFHRQNRRNPFRCQRTSVSGFTTTRAFFQSNSRASAAIVNRVTLSVWWGVCSRSTKKVSCLRRKRFSAARAPCERTRFRANARALTKAGIIFESRRKTAPFHGYNDVGSRHPFATKRPILAGLNCGINEDRVFAEHNRLRANAMASRTVDRIFESSSTSEPLHVPKTPVASSGRPARSSRAWQL